MVEVPDSAMINNATVTTILNQKDKVFYKRIDVDNGKKSGVQILEI